MNKDYEDLGVVDLKKVTTFSSERRHGSSSIRLLQVTDLHIFPRSCRTFEGIALKDSYEECLRLISHLVIETSPDVICLTGDIIDGRGPWEGPHAVTEAMQDIIPHFLGTPWLYLPGNHDDDHSPWKRADLRKMFQLKDCLQKHATSFHHTLLLQKAGTKVRLHIFDSGGNDPEFMYECTPQRTVQAFYQYCMDNEAPFTDEIPELVLIHIPLPEFQHLDPIVGENNLFEAALVGGKVPPVLANLAWLIRLLKLHRIAGCRRGGGDSGLFDACVRVNHKCGRPRILGIFCGHDHHSDAVFRRSNIFLGYERSGAHTPPFDWEGKAPNKLCPGARVIDVEDGMSRLATWVQTAEGQEVGSYLDMVSCFRSCSFTLSESVLQFLAKLLCFTDKL